MKTLKQPAGQSDSHERNTGPVMAGCAARVLFRCFLAIAVTALAVFGAVLNRSLMAPEPVGMGLTRPWLLVFCGTVAMFPLALIAIGLAFCWTRRQRRRRRRRNLSVIDVTSSDGVAAGANTDLLQKNRRTCLFDVLAFAATGDINVKRAVVGIDSCHLRACRDTGCHFPRQFTLLLRWCVPFAALWLIANYLFSVALTLTTVSSAIAIEQATTLFVFLLSVPVLGERTSWFKVITVSICIAGVVMVAMGDTSSANTKNESKSVRRALIGDLLVLGTSIAAASYMVFFVKILAPPLSVDLAEIVQENVSVKKRLHEVDSPWADSIDETLIDAQLEPDKTSATIGSSSLSTTPSFIPVLTWLGMIGVATGLFAWPAFFIVSAIRLEPAYDKQPVSAQQAVWISIAATTTLLFNFVLNWGILMTSPLFMRLSLSASIPVSFLLDLFSGAARFSPLRLCGTCAVFVGFLGFQLASIHGGPLTCQNRKVGSCPA